MASRNYNKIGTMSQITDRPMRFDKYAGHPVFIYFAEILRECEILSPICLGYKFTDGTPPCLKFEYFLLC